MVTQHKIIEWVDIYLSYIDEISVGRHVREEEGYKFQAVEQFQKNINLNAQNLAENLDLSIINNNLVVGNMYFPKEVLLEFAREFEDKTREVLIYLFDNSIEIKKRINETEEAFEELLELWKKNKKGKEEARSFISLRFLSLLLGYRYPDRYNALKPREWSIFCKYINSAFRIPQKTSSGEKYLIYSQYIDALRDYIKDNPQVKKIKDQLTRGLEFTDEEFRWMAQDIIYVTARLIANDKGAEVNQVNNKSYSGHNEQIVDLQGTQKMEFPLEEYLENFIVQNWNNIDFGEELCLYTDDEGTPAQQYPTSEGFIDILAKDKEDNFVVIELKKGRSNQQVVGQILSYIGWVKKNLAEDGQKVRGIIVASDGNNALHDAASMVKDFVSVKYYRVQFNFEDLENRKTRIR